MGLDHYKVEVLHYINPHLIWVLVRKEDENIFYVEQIGIYGVLPLNFTFGDDYVVKTERCEQWMPPATAAMENIFLDAAEVWFSPTYIDKKTSIFDDNTHKYGDLIIIQKDGQQINLLKELINHQYAFEDEFLFFQEIRRITTKLNYITRLSVIHKLEEAYNIVDIPKHVWEKALKSQMSVTQAAKELESSDMTSKRGVHDDEKMHLLLKNKLQDLDLCKEIDEDSAGRAITVKTSRASSALNVGLKKKLELLKRYKNDNTPKNILTDNNGSSSDGKTNGFKESGTDSEISPIKNRNHSDDDNNNVNVQPGKKSRRQLPPPTKLVAFGPAGLLPQKFAIKEQTTQDTAQPVIKPNKEEKKPSTPIDESKQDIYANADSEVNLKISNVEFLKKIKAKQSMYTSSPNNAKMIEKGETLSAMKRKIKYLQEKKAKFNDSLSSASDRDSSKNDIESDCETLSVLEEKLSLRYNINKKEVLDTSNESFEIDVRKSNVNPFKNLDSTMSVFIEKLVSPILMVHSKKENRIQPVSNMRDYPFGNEIHSVLKNMSIHKPMRPQTVSWPTILRGHSFFLIGPRNSGNTIGYLPAVCRLVHDFKNTPNHYGLSCIIVCATSHAVNSVEFDCKRFLRKAKIFACYAGINDMQITTSLLNGCDILICTPSMLVRLIQENFCLDFRNLSTFVVDDCEHISKVYPNELKFCLLKAMEIVKNRANKEWKVQFIVVSRVWCDFMSSLAKKAPDSVVCISAFEECVLYSKVATSVEFVKQENKIDNVINFLKSIDRSKKTVIACRADEEVKTLEKALTKLKYVVFACDSTMTVQELYNLDKTLREYEEPVSGPVLVCCDGNLTHLNVTDASYLVHFSLPELYSMFCKRFSVLIDKYPSIFKGEESNIKIKILLDDNNIEQLPKILHFIKRCTNEVPTYLDEISKGVMLEKDLKKAQNLVPICHRLLTMGKCPDFWNCSDRHAIFKDYDSPKDWLPKEGIITFQILHYLSAVYYSARVSSCVTKSNTIKYPKSYSLLSIKLGMYYSKEVNRKLHDMPKVGDVCAVTLQQNLFVRCQVAKVLKYDNNVPSLLLVKLIDEEKYELAKDTWLYYLPDELKNIETHVVTVVLANLMPADKDVTFSKLAKNKILKIAADNEDLYMRGHITMVIGNTIFVDRLEACQDLSSLEEVVIKSDFRKELLDGHALPNPEHIDNINNICDFTVSKPEEEKIIELPKSVKSLPKGRWAHLESDGFSSIFFMYAENPSQFFVRPIKFDVCLTALIKDIKKHVTENPEPLESFDLKDIVLAEFPDDQTYERARIDSEIKNNKVKCFFVDQAEWRDVSVNKILPINEKFITQLPFQAIECRLVGIQPVGDSWTDFSTNFFVDYCYDSADKLKQLYTKYFTKEKAEFTEGHKYGVVLIDTYSEEDVIINQMLVDKNLAEENEENKYFDNLAFERKSTESSDSDIDIEDESIKVDNVIDKAIVSDKNKPQEQPNNTANNIIRSLPLVDSDDSLSDFDFVTDNSGRIGTVPLSKVVNITEAPETEWNENILALPIEEFEFLPKSPVKLETVNSEQVSKPKVLWRQNINTVTIKINLIVDKYDITIKDRHLAFSANANDTKYGFDFELYGVVNVNKSSHCNKGLYIQVKLWKLMARNWLTLARDSAVKKWIVYDVESLDVSSDDESDDIIDVRKNLIPHADESDSDDNLEDDISFSYKRN